MGSAGERVGRGVVQDHRDHGRLQAGHTNYRLGCFRLNPALEAAERPVSGERGADVGAERVESRARLRRGPPSSIAAPVGYPIGQAITEWGRSARFLSFATLIPA